MAHPITPQALRQALAGALPPLLIDVRRAPVHALAVDQLPDARWCDPAGVDNWGPALPPGAPVVVYCVHGHQVSQDCAQALARQGHTASYLDGGIEGWRADGGPLVALANAGP